MGLIAWYPLDNNTSNNAGATALDVSGSFTYTSGKLTEWAGSFNGSDTYLYRGINLTSEMTFSAWIYFNSASAAHIIDCREPGSETGYQPLYGGPGYGAQFYSSNYTSVDTHATWTDAVCGFTTGVWYHVVVVVTETYAELFINGVSKGKVNGNYGYNFGSRTMKVGTRITNANWFNGRLNDLRIYNHALSKKEIKELSKGLALSISFNFEDLYEPLEYLESSGTQYINTGIVDTNNTSIEVKHYTSTGTSVYGTTTGFNYTCSSTYPGGYWYYWDRNTSGVGGASTTREIMTIKQDNNKCYRNGTLVHTYTAVTFTDSQNMWLFGRNGNGTISDAGTTRIYYCKIWNNTTLVRDYIPCRRRSDGVLGLFDKVNYTFVTNSGSGTFKASGYTRLLYIEATGTQKIDTELSYKDYIFEHDIKFTSISTRQLMGGNGNTGTYWGVNTSGYYEMEGASSKSALTRDIVTYRPASSLTSNQCQLIVDGVVVKTSSHSSSTANYTLFSLTSGSYWCYCRLYGFKVYTNDVNRTLVRSCTPVLRNSDFKPGLYDVVTGTFYVNGGTGEFSYNSSTYVADHSGYGYSLNTGALGLDINNKITGSSSLVASPTSCLLYNKNGATDFYGVNTFPFTINVWAFKLSWSTYNSKASQCIVNGSGDMCYLRLTGLDSRIPYLTFAIQVNTGTWSQPKITTYSASMNLRLNPLSDIHMITGVYDGSYIKLYVDGTLMTSTSASGTPYGSSDSGVNDGFRIGALGTSGMLIPTIEPFGGNISNVKVYKTALSETDIKDMYAKGYIDKKGNIFGYELIDTEDSTSNYLSLDKGGVFRCPNTRELVTLSDGSKWIPISIHYVPSGVFSSSTTGSVYDNQFRWNKFSSINNETRPSTNYEFLVVQQQTVNGAPRWWRFSQAINPLSATWSQVNPSNVGGNVIRIDTNQSWASDAGAGMYWFDSSDCPMCFANNSNGNWFGCGIMSYWGNTYIPGYNNEQVWGWQIVYMRVSGTQAKVNKYIHVMDTSGFNEI